MRPSAKLRTTVGVIGFLAIASSTVSATAPAWATEFVAVNNAPTGLTQTTPNVGCLDCSYYGSFGPGGELAMDLSAFSWNYPLANNGGFSVRFVQTSTNSGQHFVFGGATPWLAAATMTCKIYGVGPLQVNPDYSAGYTCTVGPLTGQRGNGKAHLANVRINTNKVVVKNGYAKILVAAHARTKFKVSERIVLRSANGKLLGKKVAKVTTGKPTYVKVPVPQRVSTKVKAGKHILVAGRVGHADKTNGTGHKTTRLVLTRS